MTDFYGVLRRFQCHFNCITATACISMHAIGFTSRRLGLLSALPKDTPTNNPVIPARLKPLSHAGPFKSIKFLTHYHTIPTFDAPEKEDFRKYYWKMRKCW